MNIGKRYVMAVDTRDALPTLEPEGTQCWIGDEQIMLVFVGGAWVETGVGSTSFDFTKTFDELDVPETYITVAQLTTANLSPGVYMLGFSVSMDFASAGKSVFVRWQEESEGWNEIAQEPSDQTNTTVITYTYPRVYPEQVHEIVLQVRKEDAASPQLDVRFADVWLQRVK